MRYYLANNLKKYLKRNLFFNASGHRSNNGEL